MKFTITLASMLTAALLLSACGGGSSDVDSNTGGVPVIEGKLIDAPVEGAVYRCGNISNMTDRDGNFACDTFPVSFYVGDVKLGKLSHLPDDGYVTPHDLLGVSRREYSDTVAKLALFLQSLDDDGEIDQVITLDKELIEKLKNRHLDIATMSDTEIIELLDEIGVVNIVSKESALEHLRRHLTHIDTPSSDTDDNSMSGDGNGTPAEDNNTTQLGALNQAYLDLINEARAEGRKCGEYGYMPAVDPLTWNDKLYNAAYEHSKDMAISNTFSHTGSGTQSDRTAQAKHPGTGSSVGERIEYNDYTNWHGYGENIAAGTVMDEAIEAMEGWLESPGHCKNIMSSKFKEVSMAVYYNEESHYKYYWTQDFGTK